MTLDGFLTIIGLAIAVLALLSPVARLTLRLQSGRQTALAVAAVIAVLYLEFFQIVAVPCPRTLGGACGYLVFDPDGEFTPQMAAFLVVVAWAALAWITWSWSRPSVGSMKVLGQLVDELVRQKRIGDLVDLMEPWLPLLRKVLERDLASQRLRDWLSPLKPWDPKTDVARDWWDRGKRGAVGALKICLRPIAWIWPSQRDVESEAARIADTLYLDKDVSLPIVMSEVRFAAMMLGAEIRQALAFSDSLLATQIGLPGGALNDELKRTENVSERTGYFLSPDRPLLFALLEDTGRAKDLQAWTPVGNHVIRLLAEPDDEYARYLRGPAGHFDEERWRDPTACAVHFFDIMVRRAALQGTQSHMWLMFMRHFVEGLEKTYDSALSESDAEFPCRSARLLYEIFSAMGAWIKTVANIPPDSVHARLPNRPGGDGEGIAGWACICMGQCLQLVVMSDKIGASFSAYMLTCTLNDMNALTGPGAVGAMRAHLAACLASGSGWGDRLAYSRRLAGLFNDVDPVLRERSGAFREAAHAMYPNAGF